VYAILCTQRVYQVACKLSLLHVCGVHRRAARRGFESNARTLSLRSESRAMAAPPVLVVDENCFAPPCLFHLPRAARLRKKSAEMSRGRVLFRREEAYRPSGGDGSNR
jgi:hypothetical protein